MYNSFTALIIFTITFFVSLRKVSIKMKDSDLIKLAKQNIAAGKRFAIKVIIGISIIFTF